MTKPPPRQTEPLPRHPSPGVARWAWHYRTLVALRDHLVQQSKSPGKTDVFDRDFVKTLLARERDPLGEINAAIRRIEEGHYGVCEHTGRPIDANRLRALPWTRHAGDVV
jgi:hypothetical protein